jgi:hypothetical protein
MYTKPPSDPIKKVDWLYNHLSENLHEDLTQPRMWQFTLRPKTVELMTAIADSLDKHGYDLFEQDAVQETHVSRGKSRTFIGPPMLMVFARGAFKPAQLKTHVRRMLKIAATRKAKYEGIDSMDIEEFETIFGPPRLKTLAGAVWLLRHYSDTGLRQGARIRYNFGLRAKDPKKAAAALKAAGYKQVKAATDECNWDLDVIVSGKNDDKYLTQSYKAMRSDAKSAGATLGGVLL